MRLQQVVLLLNSAVKTLLLVVAAAGRRRVSLARVARVSLSGPEPEGSPATSRHLSKLGCDTLLKIGS